MNMQKLIATAALAFAAGSALSSEMPVATSVTALSLNLPTVTITQPVQQRDDVRNQAVEFVKHYKTTLAVQLEQLLN